MLPPALYIKQPGKTGPNNKILEEDVIPIIKKIGNQKNVEIIDLYKITKNHPEWFKDMIHPNKEANVNIAKEIARIIK